MCKCGNVGMWICIDGREPSSGSHQPHGPSSSTCTYLTLRSCALHMPISIYSVPTSLTKTVGSSVINSCHPLLSTPVGKLQCPRDFCSTLGFSAVSSTNKLRTTPLRLVRCHRYSWKPQKTNRCDLIRLIGPTESEKNKVKRVFISSHHGRAPPYSVLSLRYGKHDKMALYSLSQDARWGAR